jgi:hypothetical protein
MFAAPTPRRLVLIAAAALAGSFMAISPALPMFPAPSAAVQTALAEPAPVRSRPVRVRSQAEAAPAEAGSCSTTRLKLWIEDEGWVVRRIHRCW